MGVNDYFRLLLEQHLDEYIGYYYSKLFQKIDWAWVTKTIPSPSRVSDGFRFNHLVEVYLNKDDKQVFWIHWNLHPKLDLQFMDNLSQEMEILKPLELSNLHILLLIADKRLQGDAKQYIQHLWPYPEIGLSVANVHDENTTYPKLMAYINKLLLGYQQYRIKLATLI